MKNSSITEMKFSLLTQRSFLCPNYTLEVEFTLNLLFRGYGCSKIGENPNEENTSIIK